MTKTSAVTLAAALGLCACAGPSATTQTPAPAPAPAAAPAPQPAAAPVDAALLSPETAGELAPASFRVRFETTKGPFVVEVTRSWSAMGADRFYNLVKRGYYDGVAFFRVLPGFMAQTGIHGSPEVNAKWRVARIPDDPREKSNTRGRVTFATSGPNSRTTQIFFNYGDNSRLDGMGFSPFGEVVEGMETLDALHGGYGEGYPGGAGPDQSRIQGEGNAYLRRDFPNLDYIKSARLL
ncbi:MAG: peptidylprolyl isomerase [Elusimicrobiota bacterium]|nr:peptidylprolyl isomerase [Elusimicrobiota bacterium]